MIVRTKSGDFRAVNSGVLLDFLGVKFDVAGAQKVKGDVELIAAVPFLMRNEELGMSNEEKQEGVAWTLSTFDLDRFGERIEPLGWDITQYVKNPVVQWAHCFDIPAIGKIQGLSFDDKGLHGVVVFNSKDYDAFGWGIGQRVKAGVLCAGSVGFRVIEIEIPDKETAKDGTSLIFTKQELLEFSICNVPANPFALARRKEMRNEELEMSNGENAESNERLPMGNEQGAFGRHFWGGLINNFEE